MAQPICKKSFHRWKLVLANNHAVFGIKQKPAEVHFKQPCPLNMRYIQIRLIRCRALARHHQKLGSFTGHLVKIPIVRKWCALHDPGKAFPSCQHCHLSLACLLGERGMTRRSGLLCLIRMLVCPRHCPLPPLSPSLPAQCLAEELTWVCQGRE